MRVAAVFIGDLLTDAREGIAYEHVDDTCTAVAGVDDDGIGRLLADLPDDACFIGSLDKLDGVEGDISKLGGDDGDELALVGDVQGSRPRSSQAPRTSSRTGISSSLSSTERPQSRASSLREVASPPRVGSRIQRMPGAAWAAMASIIGSTERVSEDRSASRSRSARARRMVMP